MLGVRGWCLFLVAPFGAQNGSKKKRAFGHHFDPKWCPKSAFFGTILRLGKEKQGGTKITFFYLFGALFSPNRCSAPEGVLTLSLRNALRSVALGRSAVRLCPCCLPTGAKRKMKIKAGRQLAN